MIEKLKRVPEKRELELRSGDLGRAAAEVLDDLEETLKGRGVTRKIDEVICMMDVEEMKKVVINLVINAVDATDGKGEIGIEVATDGQIARLTVQDSGCGMSREYISGQLFRPFRTTKKKGLGIGLYQCRQIVEAHGGRIDAASTPGKGTEFSVGIPLLR